MTDLALVKAHAYGNDFLLVQKRSVAGIPKLAPLARALCDRHRGYGADGLMVVDDTPSGARTQLLNADGSPSEISGNGIRCVAAWLAHRRLLGTGKTVELETEAGIKTVTILKIEGTRYTCRADMGQPTDLREETLDVAGESLKVVVLRVGNPQCVVLGGPELLTRERLDVLGAGLTNHPHFPEGTNVELACVEAADRVRILIWERGVGPTEASGTGACASAVAAAAFGGANKVVDVIAPGGTQRVEWSDGGIDLTGWAELTGSLSWWGPGVESA